MCLAYFVASKERTGNNCAEAGKIPMSRHSSATLWRPAGLWPGQENGRIRGSLDNCIKPKYYGTKKDSGGRS